MMISGSGAQMQMQSTSYIPAYYHIIDQNVGGSSGSLWQVVGSSSSSTCKIGMVYNVLPESSNLDPYLPYNKEILRQTMLKHEAVFRNQVHELHRLYGKQKELMNEISRNRWQMQSSQSNLISSQIWYNNFQIAYSATSVIPGDDGKQPPPPAQSGENFQIPSSTDVVSSIRAHSTIYIKENSSEEQKISVSKSCYSGKKMLDLQLPAEEFIDSEDEQEVLKNRNPVQIMPQVQYEHSKNSLKLNETSSSNGSSNCSKTTFLFDLNEPIQLDESEMPNSTDFLDSAKDNIMSRDQDSFGMSKLGSHVQNEESTYNVPEGKGDEGNGLISGRQDSSAGGSVVGSKVVKKESEAFDDNNQSVLCSCITNSCSPVLISNEAITEASTSVSSQQTSICESREVVPFAIQALPCFNNPELLSKKTSRSSSSNSGIKRKYCNSKGNLASTPPSLESGSCDNEYAAEQSSPAECIKKSHLDSSEDIAVVDVMPKNEGSQEKHSRTDEASSSENLKRQFIRPRMKPDFDGTNLKAPGTPDKNEQPPPIEDLDRIAAEAIVSISSSDIQQLSKNHKMEVSASCDCLSWFASVASCVTSDQEINEIEFESFSFKLNGMNLEDCRCPQIQSHEEDEKGRGKKRKSKTRQKKGSLSCITSLHSSNVIKNLEPAGTIIKDKKCFGGCRRRIGGRRSSKKLKTVTTNEIEIETETETKVCSILKQHTTNASHEELSFTLKSLLGWGSKNRRQKSRHAPANCFLDF